MKLKTEIRIQASPDEVWKVLTNFKSYPEWNPLILSFSGDVREGQQIDVQLPTMSFQLMVLTWVHNKKFEWVGHLWFKGVFDGRHSFVLIENQDGSTQFHHEEAFSGILVPFLKKKINGDIRKDFERMNSALKTRVEKRMID